MSLRNHQTTTIRTCRITRSSGKAIGCHSWMRAAQCKPLRSSDRASMPLRKVVIALAVLAISFSALPLGRSAAEPPVMDIATHVLIRLPDRVYRAMEPDVVPALRTLDYGPFVWLEVAATDLAHLQATIFPHQVYTEPFTLRLGEQSIDPLRDQIHLPQGWGGVRGHGPDLHLVQFAGPTRDEWIDRLVADGLEIVQHIHPFTYVVWGDLGDLDRSAGADFVRWTGPFAPAYRVLPQWQNLEAQKARVDVLLYRGADTASAIRQIEGLGGQSYGRAILNETFEIASFAIDGSALQAAAQVPGVYSIQLEPVSGGLRGEMSNQVNVNNLDGSNVTFPGYASWLASLGVDGSGVIIANVDAGVQNTHPDLASRLLPCTGDTCGGSATSGHGTHTAGIMVGDGSSEIIDGSGFLRGLGMAPGANLVEQVYDPWFQQPGGMLQLISDSYANGASISSNSWGPADVPQGYDNDTMQVDIGIRDADPNTPGNQPLTYVLSIMNGFGGNQTQGSPDEAKNTLSIGSTNMQSSDGTQLATIDDLSANTAHGPALDGRTIPHMVAPGCYVDSTVSNGHGTLCGTSMAAPSVSGAVALFIQYYRGLFGGADPSPALIKAAFLPVAHDLSGHKDADNNTLGHPFDSKQGWGRMDSAAALNPPVPVAYFDHPVTLGESGEQWLQTMAPADPGQPVRVMLVWTDAPGHGLGGSTPAWNNDLDLVVEIGDDSYWGNNFGLDGWSQAGLSADAMNNTEGVFLRPGATGDLTIRVVASNINSDGVPNQGDVTDQDFALVCYNCASGKEWSHSYLPLVSK